MRFFRFSTFSRVVVEHEVGPLDSTSRRNLRFAWILDRRAANSESCVIVLPRPVGRPGCVRSSAWIWLFSSKLNTAAFPADRGSGSSPRSAGPGSAVRSGLRPCDRHTRLIDRHDQCVASSGAVCVVARTGAPPPRPGVLPGGWRRAAAPSRIPPSSASASAPPCSRRCPARGDRLVRLPSAAIRTINVPEGAPAWRDDAHLSNFRLSSVDGDPCRNSHRRWGEHNPPTLR